MKKITGTTLFILMGILIWGALPVEALSLTPEEILLNLDKKMNLEWSCIMDFEVITYEGEDSHQARVRVYIYDSKRSIATFLAPERFVNDRYLVVGHNTWKYQEGLRRPIRISPRQKLFGEAGIAETMGIDYYREYKPLGMEEEKEHFILKLKARDSKTAYQMADLYVSGDSLQIERVILKGVNGEPLKELIYHNHREMAGIEVADITVKNLLYERDRKTVLIF